MAAAEDDTIQNMSEFDTNIEMMKGGVKSAFLWYPPNNIPDLLVPDAPDGFGMIKVPHMWKGGRGVIFAKNKDIQKIIKKLKNTNNKVTKAVLLGQILGYLYPSDLISGKDCWWASFFIKEIGLVWSELLPVEYDLKKLNKLYDKFKKVVSSMGDQYTPELAIKRGPFQFGNPYNTHSTKK